MSKYLLYTILLLCCAMLGSVAGQPIETVHGVVVDKLTGEPLPGAVVSFLNTSRQYRSSTDFEGRFQIENLPAGRHEAYARFPGYENLTLQNFEVVPGKACFLIFELEQMPLLTKDIFVRSYRTGVPRNPMGLSGVQSFDDEAVRSYPLCDGDYTQWATQQSGAINWNDGRSEMSLLGKSPVFTSWRIEGVPVAAPVHLAWGGDASGLRSAQGMHAIEPSDFYTGASPAKFGNAMGGLFDLNLRAGSRYQWRHMAQLSNQGGAFFSEGPLKRRSRSSYILNYRHDNRSDFKGWLPAAHGGLEPDLRDLSFKLTFPTRTSGTFSLFGMASRSDISHVSDSDSPVENLMLRQPLATALRMDQDQYMLGFSHEAFALGKSMTTKLTLALSGNEKNNLLQHHRTSGITPFFEENHEETRGYIAFDGTYKRSVVDFYAFGISAEIIALDYTDSLAQTPVSDYRSLVGASEDALMVVNGYFGWHHKFSNVLSAYAGLHGQLFRMNNSWAIEPRLNVTYEMSSKCFLSAAYGWHSQMQPLPVYFQQIHYNGSAAVSEQNRELKMSKSHQLVVTWDQHLIPGLRFKLEGFGQYHHAIPVSVLNGSYTMLNNGSALFEPSPGELRNDGTGHSVGAKLLIEKYLADHFFVRINTALFDAKFTGSDGVVRKSPFNVGYHANVLVGTEVDLSENFRLALNIQPVFAGGRRLRAIDEELSQLKGYTMYDNDLAYEEQGTPYFSLNAKASLRWSMKKVSQEFAIDGHNLTDNDNLFSREFNPETNLVENVYQRGNFFWMMYRIYF